MTTSARHHEELSLEQVRLNRTLLFSFGLAYLIWWPCVEYLLPGSFNPLGSRLAVVLFSWALLACSYVSEYFRKHLPSLLYLCTWSVTLHYFYLFQRNVADINWVVGSYIAAIAIGSCLQSMRAFLSYAIYVLVLSVLIVLSDPALLKTIFLPGMITILYFIHLGILRRLKAQDERIKYESARETLKIREEFISIASHELKTPLTNIKMHMQLAERDLETKNLEIFTEEKFRFFVSHTSRNTERLIRLVEEMLDFSKISAGNLQITKEKIDLVALTKEALRSCECALKDAGCELEFRSDESIYIEADRFRIEQVILNLLSNAMKYGKGKPIQVLTRTRDGAAEIVVQDNGIGISEEDQSRIFMKFERAASSRSISGLGLGLYISQQIVRQHDGEISVTSQLGKGARFTVTLPN